LRLDEVLNSLAEVALQVLAADKTSVNIWNAERQELEWGAAIGYSAETTAVALVSGVDLPLERVLSAEVFVVNNAETDPSMVSPRMQAMIRREGMRSLVGAPIIVAGQPFGLFAVAFSTPHVSSRDERRLVHAIGQRAGVAIHNARLFEQAQQVATAEERQRLARELHDAVTQTLFSASLIAEVLPRLAERNPEEGRRRLEELRQLTRGALAEMRTLLLELRPAALLDTPFGQLLQQLAEASASRGSLHIDVDAEGEGALPADLQIGLYRIAQEALNNINKHSGAKRVEIRYRRSGSRVDLRVTDDGRGFDTRSTPPGHFGLSIMRERARAIGAQLRIESRPNAGTRIDVHWRGVKSS